MKVATSPARMDPGPDRLTLLVGSGERDFGHVHDIPHENHNIAFVISSSSRADTDSVLDGDI